MSASMRHGALLVAITGTLLVGAQFMRPTHADAGSDSARAIVGASLDGRLPDGAPATFASASATAETRTLLAVTALDPPRVAATAAARAVEPTETPVPLAAPIQSPRTTAIPTLTRITATPEPTVQAAVVMRPPSRYATVGELNVALAQTAWPAELWPTVVAIALCESGVDRDRDGRYEAVDTQASGAGGRYVGPLQIGTTHRFSQQYDLWSLVGNLQAGYELWAEAGHSFAPWGCR